MNPRIDDDVKKARGTYRKDRELPNVSHEPGETKPRRPSRLTEYAAEFWKIHFNHLWDEGWLSRQNLESFITVCGIYADMRELGDDIAKKNRTYKVTTQSGKKQMERPEWKMFRDSRNDLMRWSQEMGITPASMRRYLLGDKKAEKDKAKETGKKPANIRDFVNAG